LLLKRGQAHLLVGLFGGHLENLGQCLCRPDVQIDRNIEDPVELPCLATPEFNCHAAARPLRICGARIGAFQFEDTPATWFPIGNRVA
jgi:hypothetical protein